MASRLAEGRLGLNVVCGWNQLEFDMFGHEQHPHDERYVYGREWLEIGIPELLAGPGVKLIEWPKREFEEFEEGHVEVTIRVLDDGSREIDVLPLSR